jgi:hypothetical protein
MLHLRAHVKCFAIFSTFFFQFGKKKSEQFSAEYELATASCLKLGTFKVAFYLRAKTKLECLCLYRKNTGEPGLCPKWD